MTDAPGLQPREGQLFGRLPGKARIGAPSQRWQARLSDGEVRDLRLLSAKGMTYAQLAVLFGISPSSCYAIVQRVTYRHVS